MTFEPIRVSDDVAGGVEMVVATTARGGGRQLNTRGLEGCLFLLIS